MIRCTPATAAAVLLSFLASIESVGCKGTTPEEKAGGTVDHITADLSNPVRVIEGDSINGFGMIAWAGQLTDGTVVVGDRRLSELSFFPASSPPFVAARWGEGPGELSGLWHGGILPGDSIMVSGMRISLFDGAGRFQRSFPSPHPGAVHTFLGSLRDSSLVFEATLDSDLTPGLHSESASYMWVDRVNGVVKGKVSLPSRPSFVGRSSEGRTMWTYPPFFGRAVAGVFDSHLIWGNGSEPFLILFDQRGVPLDSIRLEIPRKELTRAHLSTARSARLAQPGLSQEQRSFWRSVFQEVQFPDHLPYFEELLIGSDAMIWLRAPSEGSERVQQWLGFDHEGHLVSTLSLPPNLDLLQVSDSMLMVVEKSELDIQTLKLVRVVFDSVSSEAE